VRRINATPIELKKIPSMSAGCNISFELSDRIALLDFFISSAPFILEIVDAGDFLFNLCSLININHYKT